MMRISLAPEKRVLFIGLGSIGRRHARNLRTLGVSNFIAYRSGKGAASEREHGVEYFNDLDVALRQRPDVAIIANPTSQHVSTAIRVAKAGVPFFLEKPLSDSMDGLDELLQLVHHEKLLTLIGFNLRFHPTLVKASKMISDGRIGRVLYIRAEVGQYLPDWRPEEDYRVGYGARKDLGGGVVLDLIHEMDYATWLAGPLASVGCLASRVSDLEIETEDIAELTLRFGNGAIGSVHMDYLQRAPHRAFRVVGDIGTMVGDLLAHELRLYDSRQGKWETFADPAFERNDMYLDEMRHLLNCLVGREQPRVDLASAMDVHQMTLGALRKARGL